MPAKLYKINNTSKASEEKAIMQNVVMTNEIAAARVHVERTIQRFKMFKILKQKISWSLTPYIDNIYTVIAGIVNLKNPILADNKF